MTTTKFLLDLRGKAKDGKGSILIRIWNSFSSTTISTGVRVSPDNWDGKEVINHPNSSALNASINEEKAKIDRAIAALSFQDNYSLMTASEIKNAITAEKPIKPLGHSIFNLFKEYMETGDLQEGSKHLYRSAMKKIVSFSGPNTMIENMDFKWLRSFDTFLSKTQTMNGKAIYLRHLRAVMNYAIRSGITCPYPFAQYKIKQAPTNKRSVSVEKLREFYNYPCRQSQRRYRDYFFLMFYLIGINAKDLLMAKPDAIRNGRFEYQRSKTHKAYSIKVEPEANELINRYHGKNYLLEVMDHCTDYRNFLHKMNDTLGMIGPETKEEVFTDDLFSEPQNIIKTEPIIPGITSYWARHTWATMAYELDLPIDVVSQALGHSMGNRTTLIYIKQDIRKVDKANRAVIDYFLEK